MQLSTKLMKCGSITAASDRFTENAGVFPERIERVWEASAPADESMRLAAVATTTADGVSLDIDNQLKTLFDALRTPHRPSELPLDDTPQDGEDPFFCLLDDDSRIVDVRVITDRHLNAPAADHVLLTMRVRTRATQTIYGNIGLA